MPVKKQDRVLVACPHCGHQQPESPSAFSTICKSCGHHLRVQDILKPAPKAAGHTPQHKRVICFECGAELDVPVSAESTMCKRCSRYVDLHDYRIASAVAKNFKTKGTLVVELKGYVFNSDTIAGDAVIMGKFHGKLFAERSLTIYSTADIKGTLTAGHLIIPAENHFRWADPIKVHSGEIAGELTAPLHAQGTVTLKPSARMFGNIEAASLIVEAGAVVVGMIRVGAIPSDHQTRLI